MSESVFLTMAIHAEAKKGKTRLGATAPKPVLFFDIEAGGMRFVPGRKIEWDPMREPIPDMTDYDICRVRITSTEVLKHTIELIKNQEHQFASFVLDSLTMFQDNLRKELNAAGFLDQRDWGTVLVTVADLVHNLQIIADRQEQVKCCVVICGTEIRDGKFRPILSGAFKNRLSYALDATGFLFTQRDDTGRLRRGLRIIGDDTIDAGQRFPGSDEDWPEVIWDPDLTTLIEQIERQVTDNNNS